MDDTDSVESMEEASLTREDIDEGVLIGGCTNMVQTHDEGVTQSEAPGSPCVASSS